MAVFSRKSLLGYTRMLFFSLFHEIARGTAPGMPLTILGSIIFSGGWRERILCRHFTALCENCTKTSRLYRYYRSSDAPPVRKWRCVYKKAHLARGRQLPQKAHLARTERCRCF